MFTVYSFIDTSGDLLYVGMTSNYQARLQAHRSGKPWWPDVAGERTIPIASRVEALELERELIRAGHPKHNIQHSLVNGPAKKQTTRLLKLVCPVDGYTVRGTRMWIDKLGLPACPCGADMTEAS